MKQRLTILATLVLVGATAACFFPLVQHPTDLLVGPQRGGLNDVTDNIIATRNFPAESLLRDGALPFWNPYALGGEPWLGNPQTALFYPPNWLLCLLTAPFWVGWMMAAHHLLGGAGMYRLCRRYGFEEPAALCGAVAYLAAPYYLVNTAEGHYNPVCLMAWAPWALLAFERVRNAQRGGVSLVALVFALCFFCGHVQELFYLVVIMSAFMAADALHRFRNGSAASAWRLLRNWIAAGAATAGLIAIDFLPIWIYTRQAARAGGLTSAQSSSVSLGLSNLLQLIDPFILGGPDAYSGPGVCYWETLTHFGVVPLLLAACGVVGGWRRYPVQRIAAVWLVTMLFAFGTQGPIYHAMHHYFPGIALFRAPSRALFHTSLATAVLAAAGVDALLAAARAATAKARGRVQAIALIAVVCTLATFAATHSSRFSELRTESLQPAQEAQAAADQPAPRALTGIRGTGARSPLVGAVLSPAAWCYMSLAFALIWAAWRWPLRVQFAGLGLTILCAAELSLFSARIFRTIPAAAIRERSPLAVFLKEKAGLARIVARQDVLSDREAWAEGLYKVHAYEPVPLLSYTSFIDAVTKTRDPVMELVGFDPIDLGEYHHNLIDFLGVRYAVLQLSQPPATIGTWKLAARGGLPQQLHLRGQDTANSPFAVYENPTAMPRAFVLGRVREVRYGENPVAVLQAANPRRELVLPHDALPAGPRQEFQPASIVNYTPNRVTISAELDAPGYLVLSDVWYSGWKAEDNGQPVPVLQANLAFRAVPLAAGKHEVVFKYTPPGLTFGGFATFVTVVTLLVTNLNRRDRAAAGTISADEPKAEFLGRQVERASCAVADPSASSA